MARRNFGMPYALRPYSAVCYFSSFKTTAAGNPNYLIIEYPSINTATVNGKWTANDVDQHTSHTAGGNDLNIRDTTYKTS